MSSIGRLSLFPFFSHTHKKSACTCWWRKTSTKTWMAHKAGSNHTKCYSIRLRVNNHVKGSVRLYLHAQCCFVLNADVNTLTMAMFTCWWLVRITFTMFIIVIECMNMLKLAAWDHAWVASQTITFANKLKVQLRLIGLFWKHFIANYWHDYDARWTIKGSPKTCGDHKCLFQISWRYI